MSKYDWGDESPFKLDLMHDDVPLGQIKQIHAEWFKAGELRECLCCGRVVKAYPRRINAQMVRALALLTHRAHSSPEIIRMTRCRSGAGDHHKLAFWGLVSVVSVPDEDDRLRITTRGRSFAYGRIPLPKYCLIYNDRAWGFSKEQIFVEDCKIDFDLGELLAPETVRQTEWA